MWQYILDNLISFIKVIFQLADIPILQHLSDQNITLVSLLILEILQKMCVQKAATLQSKMADEYSGLLICFHLKGCVSSCLSVRSP